MCGDCSDLAVGFPRIRGGDPKVVGNGIVLDVFSPHPRG